MLTKCGPLGRSVSVKTTWIAAAAVVLPSLWHGGAMPADEPQATRPPAQAGQAAGRVPITAGRGDLARDTIERFSESEIKAFYARCSDEAAERKLDGGEAMLCSVGYEVLLRKHFSGNFDLLLAWSRSQLDRQGQGR